MGAVLGDAVAGVVGPSYTSGARISGAGAGFGCSRATAANGTPNAWRTPLEPCVGETHAARPGPGAPACCPLPSSDLPEAPAAAAAVAEPARGSPVWRRTNRSCRRSGRPCRGVADTGEAGPGQPRMPQTGGPARNRDNTSPRVQPEPHFRCWCSPDTAQSRIRSKPELLRDATRPAGQAVYRRVWLDQVERDHTEWAGSGRCYPDGPLSNRPNGWPGAGRVPLPHRTDRLVAACWPGGALARACGSAGPQPVLTGPLDPHARGDHRGAPMCTDRYDRRCPTLPHPILPPSTDPIGGGPR